MTARARTALAALAGAVGAGLFALAPVGSASATAGSPAVIGAPVAERAPRHELGGIMSPYVACRKPRLKPHVLWTLNAVATGEQTTYSWVGAIAAARFPRVEAGGYVSTVTATCKGHQTVRTQSVVVARKTAATTMSHAEYGRIVHGMTKKRVAHLVGYAGRSSVRTRHGRVVTYDMNAYGRRATVRFRHAHVVGKHWDLGAE